MSPQAPRHSEGRSLRDYGRVLRRRKWIALPFMLLVPAVAVTLSVLQRPVYEGSAELLLSHDNAASTLTGSSNPSLTSDLQREAQTQAQVASVPAVAQGVIDALRLPDRDPQHLLKRTTVAAQNDADLLVISVRDADPGMAARLATEYARQFTIYRGQLDTGSLRRARAEVRQRLRTLRDPRSRFYASLVDKDQQLQTLETLQTSTVHLVRPAKRGDQVSPKPLRNGILGALGGLVLGFAFALLSDAFDTRIRTAEEIEEILELPLLARVPPPDSPSDSKKRADLAMLSEPLSPAAEAFRVLRTNVEFANLEREAKSFLITSAVHAEGKSTTAANLAFALARVGRHVILVDLDLRRPSLGAIFDLEGPGLTEVVLGQTTLEEALTVVPVDDPPTVNGDAHADVRTKGVGLLEILPAGVLPPNPGEFVDGRRLAELLEQVRERADIVIVDAPPMLDIGDSMTLSARIDALLVVTRMGVIRRPMLGELRRLLNASPTGALGFVLTGVKPGEAYGYEYHGTVPSRARELVG